MDVVGRDGEIRERSLSASSFFRVPAGLGEGVALAELSAERTLDGQRPRMSNRVFDVWDSTFRKIVHAFSYGSAGHAEGRT